MARGRLVEPEARARTSGRALTCLTVLLGGYLAVAIVAGAPSSPLTVLLPRGAEAPGWARWCAQELALDGVSRDALSVLSVALIAVIAVAFTGLLVEAWSGRISSTVVAAGTVGAIVIVVAAPLLLSRDAIAYADAGRVAVVHHRDPYAVSIGSFPHDPFVQVTSGQWLAHHTVYGPAFTLVSEAIARLWVGSPVAVIAAFKVLAGLAVGVAALCAWLAARTLRPERAAFAVAVVGLNPAVIVHTVGGGHVDAILAALLAGAFFLAIRAERDAARAVGVTACLALACLVKVVLVPLLALWLWRLVVSSDRSRRVRVVATHGVAMVGIATLLVAPFVHGRQSLAPLLAVGGLEAWASPAHLVARTARAILGSTDGRLTNRIVVAAFLLAFVALFIRLGRRAHGTLTADAWGSTLLLLALAMPFLLPWYVCWFAPFLGLMSDELLARIGVAVSLVLATTLVPADPFHGLSSPRVLGYVHDVAAPLLLVLFAIAVLHVWRAPFAGADPQRRRTVQLASTRSRRAHRSRWFATER